MSEPDMDYRQFFCMSCGVKLRTKASKAGKQLPCPKCATVLIVPDLPISSSVEGGETYDIRLPEETLRPLIAPHEQSRSVLPVSGNAMISDTATESYAISGASADYLKEQQDGSRKRHGLIQEPSVRPTLPRWPLLQGVLSFLLEPGAIVHWSILSFISVLWLPLLAVAMNSGDANVQENGIATAYTCGIVLLSSMFVAVPCSACFIVILQESAAGNRMIEEWPWFAFRNYILESFYIINSVLTSAGVAWLLTYPLAGFVNARTFFCVFCFVILLPIVLLSMLEAGSCLVPVSLVVYQGLRRSWRTWLVFYVESLVLVFGILVYLGVLDFLWQHHSEHITFGSGFMVTTISSVLLLLIYMLVLALTLMMIVAAPVVLLAMIYFRLLGRLARIIQELWNLCPLLGV